MGFTLKGERDLTGELNINTLIRREDGTSVLLRQPYDNPHLFKELEKEYQAVGFYDIGCRLRRRSPDEQADFTRFASRMGLLVLTPETSMIGGIFSYPFLENAQPLDQALRSDEQHASTIIPALFGDLHRAHDQHVVYGDRWLPNVLWTLSSSLVHIDFDLEISGAYAVDFEVAQLAYYTAVASPASVITLLGSELSKPGWFHSNLFFQVLRKHAQFFSDSIYGDHQGIIEGLIEQVKSCNPT